MLWYEILKGHEMLDKDREKLLDFYNFSAEHWVHIRTINPIESCLMKPYTRFDINCIICVIHIPYYNSNVRLSVVLQQCI